VRLLRLATALAVIALLAGPALPGPAGIRVAAHAALVASSPSAGSILPESPSELRLAFSEPLEAELTSLDVVALDGTVLLDHVGSIDPNDPFVLVVGESDLPEGVYRVNWRTLSAADGHAAEGFFTFGVGDVGDLLPSGGGGGTTAAERNPIAIGGRWMTYVGLLGAIGLAVFSRFVLRTGPVPRQFARLLAGALGVAALATLGVATRSALDSGDAGTYLLESRNGLLQVGRAAIALVGAGAALLVPRTFAWAVAAGAGLAGVVLHVAAGHPAAIGAGAVAGGVVHVAAVATWLGGVAGLLLLAVRPRIVTDGRPPAWREVIPRFSAVALVSIGLVGLTGVYAAWVQTGELLPLGTEYGRTLLLKTLAAVAAIGIGAVNFIDGGRRQAWLGGTKNRLVAELSLAGVVLLLTGALSITPPTDEHRGVAISPIADAFGVVAPGMGMEIAPGRPGVNRITIRATDALAALELELTLDRIDDGSSTRIPLTLRGLEGMAEMEGMDHMSMAVRNDDGTVAWYADAVALPAGSRWDTSVHVLSIAGVELSRQRFAFSLGIDGIDEGRQVSILNPGSVVALLLALAGAFGLGLGLGGQRLPRCDPGTSRLALLVGGSVAVALGVVLGVAALVGS